MVLGVSAGLLVLSSSTQDGWLVLLAGLGAGLVAAALLLHPRLASLDVEVALPARARVGDELELRVTVTNRGPRTSVPLTVSLTAPSFARVQVHVPALAPGAVAATAPSVAARRRGELSAVSAALRTSAPFSLIAVVSRRSLTASTLVHPGTGDALRTEPGGTGDATETTSRASGLEVQGVREWHRGEQTGRLYARGTARHGRPLVLDRHDDVGPPGLSVVVGATDGADSVALHELLIETVAATLIARAADGGDVTASTRQPGLADVTTSDATALLDWCARLGASGAPTLADVERAALAAGPGGQVVLAQLTAPTDPSVLETLARATADRGAGLQLLHRADGRADALCLHRVTPGSVGPHPAAVPS